MQQTREEGNNPCIYIPAIVNWLVKKREPCPWILAPSSQCALIKGGRRGTAEKYYKLETKTKLLFSWFWYYLTILRKISISKDEWQYDNHQFQTTAMTRLTERLLKNNIKVLKKKKKRKLLYYLAAHLAQKKHYFQTVSAISLNISINYKDVFKHIPLSLKLHCL